MNSFKTPLVVSPLPDGRRWRLVFSFIYLWRYKGLKIRINVPVGFITDFASSPFIVWSLIPKWGRYGKAAVIHDYLYQYGALSRKQADMVFRDAMTELGVAKWRILLMYWGVRIFGWIAWR